MEGFGSRAISATERLKCDATELKSSSKGATSISRYPGESKGGYVGLGYLRISTTSSSTASMGRQEGGNDSEGRWGDASIYTSNELN